MSFDHSERALLAELADALIPAEANMPSASQADVTGQGLDAVLKARPDLAIGLKGVFDKARTGNPSDVVAELHAKDPVAFGVLAEIVSGAYFLNSDVRQAIGYAGQAPRAMEPRVDYMEDGLLESVIRRGPIFRPTPDSVP